MNNVAESSLEVLRNQIDAVDQLLVQNLSQSGEEEDCLDSVSELTSEDKEMLRSTRLRFSLRVCELLSQRMQISRQIGEVKHAKGRTEMVDEERKQIMIQSRIEWAPENLKKSVEELYSIVHDISVRIQKSEKICKNNPHQ